MQTTEQQLDDWRDFYRKLFNLELDFSGIRIPPTEGGFSRLIVIAKGITSELAYTACKQLFNCDKFHFNEASLDEVITHNTRTAARDSYAVRTRDSVEPDVKYRGWSAQDIMDRGVVGITLTERLILGAKVFMESGELLDRDYETLCTGSKDERGSIVRVTLIDCGGKPTTDVAWIEPSYARSDLSTREVIA
jgi:hypothetical protein